MPPLKTAQRLWSWVLLTFEIGEGKKDGACQASCFTIVCRAVEVQISPVCPN